MSHIDDLFSRKHGHVLCVSCTAGFPQLDSTVPVLKALKDHGADMIELVVPFSDPLANGPLMHHSNTVAVENGMTVEKLFSQLREFRKMNSSNHTPIVLYSYFNPVLQHGFEKFCERAARAGVDGLIIPDLPIYELQNKYGKLIKDCGVDFILTVTPQTPDHRIKMLDKMSSGFLYANSISSSTGGRQFRADLAFLERLSRLGLSCPVLAGIGVNTHEDFELVCRHSNGAILGNGFLRRLAETGDAENSVKEFISQLMAVN